MSPNVFPFLNYFSFRIHSTRGKQNPKVFPVPVKSLAITFYLLYIASKVLAYDGLS